MVLAALESPDMSRAEIGRVRIRPGSVLIEDLVIEKQGMRLVFERAFVRGSLWKAVLGREVHLVNYELSGLFLAVDAEGIGKERWGETLFDAAIVLAPFAFQLDQVDLNGAVEVRLGSDRLLTARLVGQGAGFGGAQMGRLNLNGELYRRGVVGGAGSPGPGNRLSEGGRFSSN